MRGWWLLVLALASSASSAAAQTAPPYTVAGITLGMSLAELRRAPPFEGHPAARLVCSNEPGAGVLEGLRLDTSFIEADALKCGFFEPVRGPSGEQLVPSPRRFLGEDISPIMLFYRPVGEADHRLAEMTFGLSNQDGDNKVRLFTRLYGSPSSFQVSSIATSFGRLLPDLSYVWDNGVDRVVVDTVSVVLNEMSVVITDERLWADFRRRLGAVARASVPPPKAGAEAVPQGAVLQPPR